MLVLPVSGKGIHPPAILYHSRVLKLGFHIISFEGRRDTGCASRGKPKDARRPARAFPEPAFRSHRFSLQGTPNLRRPLTVSHGNPARPCRRLFGGDIARPCGLFRSSFLLRLLLFDGLHIDRRAVCREGGILGEAALLGDLASAAVFPRSDWIASMAASISPIAPIRSFKSSKRAESFLLSSKTVSPRRAHAALRWAFFSASCAFSLMLLPVRAVISAPRLSLPLRSSKSPMVFPFAMNGCTRPLVHLPGAFSAGSHDKSSRGVRGSFGNQL